MSRESLRLELEELKANQNNVVDVKAYDAKIKELQDEVNRLTALVSALNAAEEAETKAIKAAKAKAKK